MSTTAPETEYGFSYEHAVDIDTSTDGTPTWQQVRYISNVNPQRTPVTQSAQTYDDLGAPNDVVVSESWTLGFDVQTHRDPTTGAYMPEVEALMRVATPDATGNKASIGVRWYDNPASGKPNPDDAFQGQGTVTINRGATGADGAIGVWNITITGRGRRVKIANPADTAA